MRPGHAFLLIFLICILTVSLIAVPILQQVEPAPDLSALVARAQTAFRTGRFADALDIYNKALAQDPKCADAYAGLVRLFIKQNDINQADDIARKGVSANPSAPVLQTALGELQFRKGHIPESERQFVNVINSGASDARAYLGLARIRQITSMYRQEKELIDRAHSLDPADPDIQKYWMRTLKRAERIKYLESYLNGESNDDANDRSHMQQYLQLLKDREQSPRHSCRLANPVETSEAELRPLMYDASRVRGFGLMVGFNGHDARLLLDTGASGLMVKKSIAQKANIQPVVRTTVGGIGDKRDMGVYLGYADSIRIGQLEFKDCLVTVSDHTTSGSEDGLIGSDVFSRYLVGIDFQHMKLKLRPLPRRPDETEPQTASLDTSGDSDKSSSASDDAEDSPKTKADSKQTKTDSGPHDRYIAPEMQKYTKVFRFDHLLLIPTRVGEGTPKLFAIDSGSSINAISPEAAREVTKVYSDSSISVKGMKGSVNQVFTADKAVLQFARFRQENQDLTAWDFSGLNKDIGTEVSGFLGFPTLRLFELDIDYRDGLVDFVFDDNAFKQGK